MPSPEVTVLAEKIAALEAEVAEATTVKAGAVTLLNKLGEMIRQSADNPAAIRALADAITNRTGEIDMSSNELADAITANTPAENEVPEENPEP